MLKKNLLLLGVILIFIVACDTGTSPSDVPENEEQDDEWSDYEDTYSSILDESFGTDGIVAVSGSHIAGIVVAGSGDFFVCGKVLSNGVVTNEMAIWKFKPDGSLDSSFGNNGLAKSAAVPGKNYSCYPTAIELDSSGNIYITGYVNIPEADKDLYYSHTGISYLTGSDMIVQKYSASGSLDTGFGGGGYVVQSVSSGSWDYNDAGYAIKYDGNTSLYVVGFSYGKMDSWSSSNTGMTCWKINTDGALNTGFGDNGVFFHGGGAGSLFDDKGFDLTITSDADILVGGYGNSNQSGLNDDILVWKITPSGTLDTAFGSSGIFHYDNSAVGFGEDDQCTGIAFDSTGAVYSSGFAYSGDNTDMIAFKLLNTGSPDTSFGSNGEIRHNSAAGGDSTDKAHSMMIHSQGYMIIVGSSIDSQWENNLAVWKISSNGALDSQFGVGGYLTLDDPGGTDQGYAYTSVAEASDGDILVCAGHEIYKVVFD